MNDTVIWTQNKLFIMPCFCFFIDGKYFLHGVHVLATSDVILNHFSFEIYEQIEQNAHFIKCVNATIEKQK